MMIEEVEKEAIEWAEEIIKWKRRGKGDCDKLTIILKIIKRLLAKIKELGI